MLNATVRMGLTVMVIVVEVAHDPSVGVKVYVPVVVLSTVAGDHVPVMPLVEVVGKIGAIPPVQIAGIAANIGMVLGVTVIILLKIIAQPLPSGVKI